jgi:hypothetical protein
VSSTPGASTPSSANEPSSAVPRRASRPAHHDAGEPVASNRLVALTAGDVETARAAQHVLPAEHQPDRQGLLGSVLDRRLEDPDRQARLAVVAGDDRAELALDDAHR